MKYLKLFEEARIRWYNKGKFIEEDLPNNDESEIIFDKEFTGFLKRNRVYDNFLNICAEFNINMNLKNRKRGDYISGTFTWIKTQEGQEFWSRINDLWLNQIKKN